MSEAWSFLEDTNYASSGRGPLASVKRNVLVQDYAETGARCLDIESFVRAIYSSWATRRLPHPQGLPWKNLAWYWIQKAMGCG